MSIQIYPACVNTSCLSLEIVLRRSVGMSMSFKRKNYSVTFKLAALDFLKTNSIEKIAREFSVYPHRMREC